MKLIHLNTTGPLPSDLLKELDKYVEYTSITGENMSDDRVVEVASDAEILLVAPSAIKPLSSSILKQLGKLNHVALVTAGYEWIDLEYCNRNDISVSTPIGANAEAVAEHVFGLFLDLAKRITEFYIDVREKGAHDFRKYRGTEMYRKTLGIVGLGNIGHRVARIAQGFDMNILAYDRSEKSTYDIKIVELEDLFKKSNFIAVTIPLTDDIENLISKKVISLMKKGVVVVNISRDGIVNKKDIVKSVKNGIVAGYGVDTAIMTPIDPDDEYLQYKNIIVIPHNAFNTVETERRVNEIVVSNIISYASGGNDNVLTFS